jgi:radical SAM protein with 4Fe4S-binding SPASM domain
MRCDLSCSFCFNRGVTRRGDIALSDFERIVSVISSRRIGQMDILGGEPTLHPQLNEMVGILYAAGLAGTISTNGRNNVPLLKDLHRKYNNGSIRVGVSINARVISRELHDYIVTCKPMVKSVCTRSRRVPLAGRDFLSYPGIEYYLIFMDPVNRNDLEASLSFEEFLGGLNALKAAHKNVRGVFCSGFLPDRESNPVQLDARCPAGVTKLSVMPDGSVYPCYLFFSHEEFRLGNLLCDDFDVIWKNPLLGFFRKFEGNACTNTRCRLLSDCHGGCPAVGLLLWGDINAPDPRCGQTGSSLACFS